MIENLANWTSGPQSTFNNHVRPSTQKARICLNALVLIERNCLTLSPVSNEMGNRLRTTVLSPVTLVNSA